MTNLMQICFTLQYVHYNLLHVSSITCSSSGGLDFTDVASGIVLLVSGRLVHRLRENSTLSQPVHLNLCTGRPLTERTIPDTASMQLTSWWWALTLILRRSRTGTIWFYTSTSNKRSAPPKLYTKSLTRDLKLMYSRFTLVRISIKL